MTLCGYQEGLLTDPSRSNWQNDGPRPIAWRAWYPTGEEAPVTSFSYSTFEMGAVALDAPVSSPRLPVVLLSHGTGGTAESLGWLARSLAAEGYVVLGVNHHGNTAAEPYRAEGFLCWWDRAADLSCLLTSLSDGAFADALDLDQVYAVGFSLGGYSVLSLAGARTSLEAFDKWRQIAGIATEGPAEFPDAGSQIPKLLETSEVFSRIMGPLRRRLFGRPCKADRSNRPGASHPSISRRLGCGDWRAPHHPFGRCRYRGAKRRVCRLARRAQSGIPAPVVGRACGPLHVSRLAIRPLACRTGGDLHRSSGR